MAQARVRDNYGRFVSKVTAHINKELEERAKVLDMNLKEDIGQEMLRTLKTNIADTYSPRAAGSDSEDDEIRKKAQAKIKKKKEHNEGVDDWNKQAKETQAITGKRQRMKSKSYVHTGILLDSLYLDITGDKVSIQIRDISYPANIVTGETRTAQQVYDYLRKGTNPPPDSSYPYKYQWVREGKKMVKKIVFVHNNPTPEHPFVEKTQAHMNEYVSTIKSQVKNKTYRNAAGYNIKKGRR